MRARIGLGVLLSMAIGLPGCDESGQLSGGLVLGTVDGARLCDVNGVEVQLRGQWLACPEQEPGCEPPEATSTQGDRISCPITEPGTELGVELPAPGRYRIEVVTVQVSGPAAVECFVDPQTGEAEVELPSSLLYDQSPVMLSEHGACP